jgi:hypothetical protein
MLLLLSLACKTDDTPTWYADVKPVMDQTCTRCHRPEGLGPGDFTTRDTAFALGERIVTRAAEQTMPPVSSDPDCRAYVGSEHMRMADEDLQTVEAWLEAGGPEGDPADDPGIEPVSGELSDPDLEVLMEQAYAPAFADEANPGNEYRCFVADPGLDEDTFITALAPIVDQDALVHHVVLLTIDEESVTEEMRAGQGWDCIDGSGGGDADQMIAAWAPGALPIEFPEGYGMRLGADQHLIFQMHYYDAGTVSGVEDRSGYAFKTTDAVDTQVYMAPLGISDFVIPAGDAHHTDGDGFVNEFTDFAIHGVFPHMHQLGQSYTMKIVAEDGTETCVVEGDYDFNNQLTYMFEELVDFPMGSTAEFSCTWNNAADNPNLPYDEPIETRYGERTDEEMCFMFTLVSPGSP